MTNTSQFAFTGRFPVFRGRVVSPLYIGSPVEGNPRGIKVKAVWDTGASMSLVSKEVADLLKLPVGESSEIRGAFDSKCNCPKSVARLMIVLGAQTITHNVQVAERPHCDLDCDVVLGLDFITLGDFALSHDGKQLLMSFTFPPINVPLDFASMVPRLIPHTFFDTEEDVDSDGNEQFRRELIVDSYFAERINN